MRVNYDLFSIVVHSEALLWLNFYIENTYMIAEKQKNMRTAAQQNTRVKVIFNFILRNVFSI